MNLGNKLRRMRQARGLTAVELAKRARVTTGFISQLEHRHTVPSLPRCNGSLLRWISP